MRIISGTYKGRVLKSKLPNGVRPTTDQARESIFNILSSAYDFSDVKFLDLFAGSGAMGLEAISRGAIHTTFSEKNAKVINYIKSNIDLLNINSKYSIFQNDSLKYLKTCNEQFTVIFIDPPYANKIIDDIINIILNNNMLENTGLLVIETPSTDRFTIPAELKIYKEKISGTSKYVFLEFVDS